MRFLFVLCLAATPLAADPLARDSDREIGSDALDNRLRGARIAFYDGGVSEYYDDGRYTYTYADQGGTGYGYYEVSGDSRVCIDFVNGFSRCDLYVLDAQGRLVVITEKGDRFPVRREAERRDN
ncbi:hypothetical protein [Marinovum sp.]|uniref:hypothetical protein n=1 Tax=Marinovum sp. TaxID=2024839 RepID=UPI002B275125|nr:hypothetical protein [Marinovum sp.]